MSNDHPLKILVAEDNSTNQIIVEKMIAKLGYTIDIVSNGLKAVKAVKEQSYDIVFMDMHMPEMDGIEATKQIRNFSKDRPKIFALTANAFIEDKNRCIDAGMNGFLAKPIIMSEVIAAIKSCSSSNIRNEEKKYNLESFREHCYNDDEVVLEISSQFIKELPLYLNEIQMAIDQKDSDILKSKFHEFKGVILNFRVESINKAVHEFELFIKGNNFLIISDNFEYLKIEISFLEMELKKDSSLSKKST